MTERRNRANRDADEAKERCEQGDAPAHRPEQLVEQYRHDDIGRSADDVGGETQPIEALRRQNIARRRGGVVR